MSIRVSLFVHDLSSNPIVRAAPIAQSLRLAGFEIEILGFLLRGDRVFPPYRNLCQYRVLSASLHPIEVVSRGRELAAMASGEVHYGFKPYWTSFYPALLASRFGRGSPLLLDVEDEPFDYSARFAPLAIAGELARGWRNVVSTKYSWMLHPFTKFAHGVSVVSTKLQDRYGGELVLHGPSRGEGRQPREIFTPPSDDGRQRFGLPSEAPVVGFAGVPRPHKGLAAVVEALEHPDVDRFHLALAGPESHPSFRDAEERLGRRCHLLGFLDNAEMGSFLSAIDIVPVIQRRNRVTEAQVPAKLLEAMAYGRAVIGSRVGDLPRILGADEASPRGWLIDPGGSDQLAAVLKRMLSDPAEVRARAERGRRYIENEASVEANAPKMRELVERAMDRFQSH